MALCPIGSCQHPARPSTSLPPASKCVGPITPPGCRHRQDQDHPGLAVHHHALGAPRRLCLGGGNRRQRQRAHQPDIGGRAALLRALPKAERGEAAAGVDEGQPAPAGPARPQVGSAANGQGFQGEALQCKPGTVVAVFGLSGCIELLVPGMRAGAAAQPAPAEAPCCAAPPLLQGGGGPSRAGRPQRCLWPAAPLHPAAHRQERGAQGPCAGEGSTQQGVLASRFD